MKIDRRNLTRNLQKYNILFVENNDEPVYNTNRKKERRRIEMIYNCMTDVDDLIFDGQELGHSER